MKKMFICILILGSISSFAKSSAQCGIVSSVKASENSKVVFKLESREGSKNFYLGKGNTEASMIVVQAKIHNKEICVSTSGGQRQVILKD